MSRFYGVALGLVLFFGLSSVGHADRELSRNPSAVRNSPLGDVIRTMTHLHLEVFCQYFPNQCQDMTELRDFVNQKSGATLPDCLLGYENELKTLEDVLRACSKERVRRKKPELDCLSVSCQAEI